MTKPKLFAPLLTDKELDELRKSIFVFETELKLCYGPNFTYYCTADNPLKGPRWKIRRGALYLERATSHEVSWPSVSSMNPQELTHVALRAVDMVAEIEEHFSKLRGLQPDAQRGLENALQMLARRRGLSDE